MVAPKILSFVKDPEGVADFIAKLNTHYDQRRPVFVALKLVEHVDYDGILVLLSVMVLFRARSIRFGGNMPANKEAAAMIVESGFFDQIYRSFKNEDSYKLGTANTILTHANRTVAAELGAKIIRDASLTVWGEKRRCPGVQRTFIELMQNTNNHASLTGEGEKHWWLSVKHVKDECRVCFSFVDYGVGVFFNLRNKPKSSMFYAILERMYDMFRFKNDAEILRLIFNGQLHRTASQKPFRGKGLPGIYEAMQKNSISNLAVVTNQVYFNSSGEEYRMLKTQFRGTFVYWELSAQNISLCDEN